MQKSLADNTLLAVIQPEPNITPLIKPKLVAQEHLSWPREAVQHNRYAPFTQTFPDFINKPIFPPSTYHLLFKTSPVDMEHCWCHFSHNGNFSANPKQCDPLIYFCTAAIGLLSIEVLLICLVCCTGIRGGCNQYAQPPSSVLHPQLPHVLKRDEAPVSVLLFNTVHICMLSTNVQHRAKC